MSVTRSAQCVFCVFRQSNRPVARRALYSTSRSLRKDNDGARQKAQTKEASEDSPPKSRWENIYTPEQLKVIEAAEKVLPKDQFAYSAGPRRKDPWSPKYLDNLNEIDPVIDKPIQPVQSNIDDLSRPADPDALASYIMIAADKHAKEFPLNEDSTGEFAEQFFEKMDRDVQMTTGKPESYFAMPSAEAPHIPTPVKEQKKKQTKEQSDKAALRDKDEEISPALVRLMQMTGYSTFQISKLRVKSLLVKRVTNQTRLGKISRMSVITVAGNGQGLVGLGEGKGEEITDAKLQSQYRAIRNMQPIMRYENRTIYGDLEGKVGATELELFARPPGFGLRCQEYIYEICRCAGIYDIAARVSRARNPMNTIKATIQALMNQKDPEDIARGRGKKLVDVRKVYYAGNV